MEKRFKKFKTQFSKALERQYGNKIKTAVLFGSFATDKAKEGSDLDMIIQLKPDVKREEMSGVRELIEELDSEHDIGGEWVFYDPILKIIHPMILEYDEIDWKEGSIKHPLIHWIISFGVSEPVFFHRLRDKGEVLLGENVLADIDVSPNLFNDLVDLTGEPFYRLWKFLAKTLYKTFYK